MPVLTGDEGAWIACDLSACLATAAAAAVVVVVRMMVDVREGSVVVLKQSAVEQLSSAKPNPTSDFFRPIFAFSPHSLVEIVGRLSSAAGE